MTLNLPRIALETAPQGCRSAARVTPEERQGALERFWRLLEERLDVVRQALFYRVERCKQALPQNAPILYQHGAFGLRVGDSQPVAPFFENYRATVSLGYIGLYEVATAFYGPNWESLPDAKQFTLNILAHLKEKTRLWSQESGCWFSVYSTPSESLTDRFARLDKTRFGNVRHITDKDYYTNSFHLDVRKKVSPFEKLDFEKDYPPYTSGGFIHYCEYPILKHNLQALEAVWDYSYDRVGYLGTNTPIDACFECGFTGEFAPTSDGFTCPHCGNCNPETVDVVKRTCGYLGNPVKRAMVHGRHEEIRARVKHLGAALSLADDKFFVE